MQRGLGLAKRRISFGGFLEDRPPQPRPARIWRFGPFEVHQALSELRRDGAPVAIEPQSLRLLIYLLSHRDRVVTPEDLVAAIWERRAVSDWAISGAIRALRGALGDTAREKRYVRTVHSRGYRFVAEVTEAAARAGIEQAHPTLLVRVFRTREGDADTAYLAEGLAEDLITHLARAGSGADPGWRVLSYNTAKALGDRPPSPDQNVTTVIDGSIRQIGAIIRINLGILDLRHGGPEPEQVWAESFDLTSESLLAGHDLIGQRLLAALAPGGGDRPARARGTRHSAAYDHYQKGRYAYFRYEPAAFVEALGHFEKAAALDPGYANAYAQQAYCRNTLYVFGLPKADQTLAPVEALARRAIAIDDRSALAHGRLGWVLGYLGRPEETEAAFTAALACDPENAEVYHAYGETMNRLARPERALPLLERVFSMDSYFPPSWEFPQGHAQILLGAQERAIAHFRSVIARVDRFIPARVQLARALWEAGEVAEARQMVAEIKARAPAYSLAHARRMFPYPDAAQAARLQDALVGAGLD